MYLKIKIILYNYGVRRVIDYYKNIKEIGGIY